MVSQQGLLLLASAFTLPTLTAFERKETQLQLRKLVAYHDWVRKTASLVVLFNVFIATLCRAASRVASSKHEPPCQKDRAQNNLVILPHAASTMRRISAALLESLALSWADWRPFTAAECRASASHLLGSPRSGTGPQPLTASVCNCTHHTCCQEGRSGAVHVPCFHDRLMLAVHTLLWAP